MNLLIVDDEIFVIQGLLDSVNWEQLGLDKIFIANNFAQAVNIFMQNEINILLSDIEMPFGSGIDLVEWVKSHFPETECVFLTCHSEFDYAKQAIKLKCFDYVLKPVKPDILEHVLENAINLIKTKEKNKKYQQYGELYFMNMMKEDENELNEMSNSLEIVENYIRSHIRDPLTVEGLAKYVHLNPDYLTRSFKKKHNQTLIDYITEQRMFLAKELLLKSGMSISMISAKVGYPNYSYFTKIFKKYYGDTPREFRQKYLDKKLNDD